MHTKSNNPHARFYGLINKLKGADKEDLVWNYSHKLTTSLAEFLEKRPADYQRMINDMQKAVNNIPKQQSDSERLKIELEQLKEEKERKHWIHLILVEMQKYGINTTDWKSNNAFTKQKKIFGKTLGEMTLNELMSGHRKMKSIVEKKEDDHVKNLTKEASFSLN